MNLLSKLFTQKAHTLDKELNLLVITDLHTVYEEEIQKIQNYIYDCCILLGDIRFDDLMLIRKYVKGSIYGVLGNHDSYGILENAGIENIHNKVITINEIKIIGFEGSSKYKKGNSPLYTQEESLKIAKTMSKADILVSHDSPYCLYKKDPAHCGLKGITEYIKKNRIPINIHGHQHINSKITLKNQTKVLGVYKCSLVNIKTQNVKHIF
ncbi:metallophosphoesterase [uncultured Clostridium sp.]|uniref:metallophosphoesterase family protein n=1 Tax=uncultured Clostridium sp. TaxID=59620 RepID=UPI0027DB261E|nr:metallophosphoesterase [uncultured Clostridium sp.]